MPTVEAIPPPARGRSQGQGTLHNEPGAPPFEEGLKQLVDEDYPDKERTVLVMDNPVSWYGAGSEHPSSAIAVRDLRSGGGAAHSPAAGDSLHPQAWQLAEHG